MPKIPDDSLIIVLNAGSSSLKCAVFVGVQLVLRAGIEWTDDIAEESRLWVRNAAGNELSNHTILTADLESMFRVVLEKLLESLPNCTITAVGHRVVHGGSGYLAPVRVNSEVIADLEKLIPFASLHQEYNLAGIRAVANLLPDVPQVACFDTAFHASMPQAERMFGLPRRYFDQGVRRYGFHGLSYESIVSRLPEIDPRAATGRTVAIHLGNGASLCGLRDSKSIATTMSFTPLDGLLMGTRAGSIDPGAVLYLLREEGLTSDQVERLLTRESGLLGISGISSDIRDLRASPSPDADEAIDLFCYRVVRETGSMVAAIGGLDSIVFTGGIGEHASEVRERICQRLQWYGVALDSASNQANAIRLSPPSSRVSVLCIPANEELIIAQHAARLS